VSDPERDLEIGWLKEATKSIKITIYIYLNRISISTQPSVVKSITEDPGGRGDKSNQRIARLKHLQCIRSMKSDFIKSDASTELFHIYAATLLLLNWECGIPGLGHRFGCVVRVL
jgi:hypothetical protein